MHRLLQKWLQTIQTGWVETMAYKLNLALLVIGPTIVFFFIKYNFWIAIFESQKEGFKIAGYTVHEMISYQVWVMIVGFLAHGYNSMQLAEDIRLGRISAYLLYPFSFWQFHAAKFLAFQAINFFVAIVTFGALWGTGILEQWSIGGVVSGVILSFLVASLWFAIQFGLGLVAFWLEETWVLRVMFLTVAAFLSGSVFPLDIFPNWMRTVLDFSPFPYMTYLPVRFFMGEVDRSLVQCIAVLLFWLVAAAGTCRWIWQRGVKHYTAAGM